MPGLKTRQEDRSATGLPEVFNPSERPWIKPENAPTEALINQVKQCPSGALSFLINNATGSNMEAPAEEQAGVSIQANGPLLFDGPLTIRYPDGRTEVRQEKTALCRCGQSGNKPFCDGSHKKAGFQG